MARAMATHLLGIYLQERCQSTAKRSRRSIHRIIQGTHAPKTIPQRREVRTAGRGGEPAEGEVSKMLKAGETGSEFKKFRG